jgi:hypothetical protein
MHIENVLYLSFTMPYKGTGPSFEELPSQQQFIQPLQRLIL